MLLGGCWSSWATSEEGEGGMGKEEEELRPQVHKSASYTNQEAVETPATHQFTTISCFGATFPVAAQPPACVRTCSKSSVSL